MPEHGCAMRTKGAKMTKRHRLINLSLGKKWFKMSTRTIREVTEATNRTNVFNVQAIIRNSEFEFSPRQ